MAGEGKGTNSNNGRENIDAFEWGQFLTWTRTLFEIRKKKNEDMLAPFTTEDVLNCAATSGAFAAAGHDPTSDFAQARADAQKSALLIIEHYLGECVESGALTKEGVSYKATGDTGATLFWEYDIDLG